MPAWPSAVAPPWLPITGTMKGSAPFAFSTVTTVRMTSGMRSMPRLPAPMAMRLPKSASASSASSAVSCAASTAAGSARRSDGTSASTTSCRGNVASGAKRTGIGQLSPQGIRSIIRGHATDRAVAVIAFPIAMTRLNSFGARTTLQTPSGAVEYVSLPALEKAGFPQVARLPYSLRILLENLLRMEDGAFVKKDDIAALASWNPAKHTEREIAFSPARVLLQDFTGVPAVVDLATMRDGVAALGGDPKHVNPLQSVELVIDHSVQVDYFGQSTAFELNSQLEYQRNRERYIFLRWGQGAFSNFRVVPPETGIVHQVNIEYLARVVCRETRDGVLQAFPDTLVGTDSHTTMVNGLGVVGWGVGGIEAEAAMLGQPISMLIPEVLGVRLKGRLPEGATATDLVLTVTERLRKQGVVGKFVEFFGPGMASLTVADRATLGNMAPGIRRDHRHLPDRRDDARLPAPDRPPGGRHRAGRGVHQGTGPVPHRPDAGSDLRHGDRRGSRRRSCPASPGRAGRRIASR